MAGQVCPIFEQAEGDKLSLIGTWLQFPQNLEIVPDEVNFMEIGHVAPMLSAYLRREPTRRVNNDEVHVGNGVEFAGGAFIMGASNKAPNELGAVPGVDFEYILKMNNGIPILIRSSLANKEGLPEDRVFKGGYDSIESFYREMSADIVKQRGKLEQVKFLSHYPDFEIEFWFEDGTKIYSGERTLYHDIHFLTMGYVGEGPRYLKHFIEAVGFNVSEEQIENIKPGESIWLYDEQERVKQDEQKKKEKEKWNKDQEQKQNEILAKLEKEDETRQTKKQRKEQEREKQELQEQLNRLIKKDLWEARKGLKKAREFVFFRLPSKRKEEVKAGKQRMTEVKEKIAKVKGKLKKLA